MEEVKEVRGKSKEIEEIKRFIKKASSSSHPVLISGETGVGKSLIAKKIHELSEREGEFVRVDSSSIPENLLESELFGYKKGAFTDAKEDKKGLIECADKGTLLFDEIGDLPINLQPKLLTVIEDKELRRLGDTKIRKLDVRYIFATNRDLKEEIKRGRFRRDLYFRISILKLHIPPLRERREDIEELVEYFLERENSERGAEKKISRQALIKLMKYDFPGNIRELQNIISRAYDIAEGREIREEDIEFEESLEEKKEITLEEKIFIEMIEGGKSYWEIVHKPFLERELNRREVKKILSLGLKKTNGSYKELCKLFNIEEKEYKRFMKVLSVHKLKE